VVTDALNLAIPNKLSRKSKFPCWFSGTLKHYIKKSLICRFKNTNSDKHYFYFAHFRKLVKVIIKTDRQRWLKSVDDSLKTHPQHFWKYVSNFKRKDNSFIQLKIDDQFVTDPNHIKTNLLLISNQFSTYLFCPSILLILLFQTFFTPRSYLCC
jgi:hypothetical protein